MPKRGDRKFQFSREWLHRQYVSLERSTYSIAKEVGCSTVPVVMALREFGIPVRRGGNRKGCMLPLRRHIPTDELRRLYLEELWSSYRLADYFGCSKPTILARLRQIGVKLRHHNDTKRGKPSPHRINLNTADVVAAYRVKNASKLSVAQQFRVSGQTIDRILREAGEPLKTLSEIIDGARFGISNPNYRPTITDEERAARRDAARQAKWRDKVYKRDGYTCQCCCDATGGNLNAHHIDDYASNEGRRWDVSNGITLCAPCHRAFHSAHGLTGVSQAQLDAFIADRQRSAAA